MPFQDDENGPVSGASPKDAGPVDRLIGKRIMMRRRELGLSQTALAEQIGISFQQLQKYEQGQNRIAVARLARIASELAVPLGFFLTGTVTLASADVMRALEHEVNEEFDVHDLLTAFLKIEEDDVRLMILNLARAAADGRAPDRPVD